MMKKLRIAITADTMPEISHVTNLKLAPFAPRQLVEVIGKLGALPVILADVQDAQPEEFVDLFDGLIIPGGPDVDPRFFGEQPVWALGRTNYKRDAFEIGLIKAAHAAGKPLFGICRGCQVINVAFGGTVWQDLPSQCPEANIQHTQKALGAYPVHEVRFSENSSLFATLGETAQVNSRHHQAVRQLGKNLKATAFAPDGVIEGIEGTEGASVVAVQWHPENMWPEHEEMKRLFADFLSRVKESA